MNTFKGAIDSSNGYTVMLPGVARKVGVRKMPVKDHLGFQGCPEALYGGIVAAVPGSALDLQSRFLLRSNLRCAKAVTIF
jgi:hypothetical protein